MRRGEAFPSEACTGGVEPGEMKIAARGVVRRPSHGGICI